MMNRKLIFILIISSVFNFVKLTKDLLDVNEKLLQNIGKSVLARSSTDPTIISLNIINLAIVFVLKTIMYGAAWLGKYIPDRLYDRRRGLNDSEESWLSKDSSLSEESWLSEPELLLLLSYLLLDGEDPAILQVACCHPRQTQRYLNIANLILTHLHDYTSNAESSNSSSMQEVQRAVDIGFGEEGACSSACTNLLMK